MALNGSVVVQRENHMPDTTQGAKETPSTFNARSDSAAQLLRAKLNADGAKMPDSAPVAVGPDGRPPAPPPPEGSYARIAIDEQQQSIGDQPPIGTPEQVLDGSQAPPLTPPGQTPQKPPTEPASPKAEQRIQELIAKLRASDAKVETLTVASQTAGESLQQTQASLQELQTQHQTMMQANLDNLDPETRMQVMQEANMKSLFEKLEQRIMGRVQPQMQQIETREQRREMSDLSDVYPAFDLQIHGPLVDMFRGKNPHCTIEQAYKAIAEPGELVTREEARAAAIPPVVSPGSSSLANARFAPAPEQSSNPEQELRDESRRIKELRADPDPAKQKEGMDLVHSHLRKRLGG